MKKQTDLEQRSCDEEDGYDAVVVGSGYGGSVASFRMSMGGIKVCLIEKGRQWEAHDFPTDSLKIMSASRVENRNIGVSFGPKDALFQLFEQGDSLAAVACGLGGGSLVNAGVMLPTPVRTRRNPKWPKEWEWDWDSCEASASTMLRVQRAPVRFPVSKVMGEIADGQIEESCEDVVKLSINFDLEDPPPHLIKLQQTGSCLACGNCLAGCPYNAKNSTDKNYILSAIQAYSLQLHIWRDVLLKQDVKFTGVFGTTEILFQSQMRGLELSDTLGCGFSCNGNTVAFLAGSPAPLTAYGLDRKQILERPVQKRPGPAISSSHTSSLGFTIQSAVLPTAYPYLVFKGIVSYGWPTGYWFFHGIIDKLKHVMGFQASQAVALNAMGYDESDGKIIFDKGTNKICFSPPCDPLLPRKVKAFQKLAKKLGGILFLSRYRSTSVHLLGGCNAASDPSHGVCNSNGQVFDTKAFTTVHPGLYVCDASLIPCSVGINPSLTIAAAAKHVSKHLVKDVLEYKSQRGIDLAVKNVDRYPVLADSEKSRSTDRSIVAIKETMKGYIGGMPCVAHLKMKMNSNNSVHGESHPLLRGKVGGYVVFEAIEKDRLHVIDGEVDLCEVDYRTPYTQYMRYRLLLASSSGSRYILEGQKIMNPFLLALKQEEKVRSPFCTGSPENIYITNTKTELRDDGYTISCKQWKCSQTPCRLKREEQQNPVLLINGYATESYWLPSEPIDLVRTLLEEGREIWLLQSRLHPLHPANNFTIEDIARFDIPAAIAKILELHGKGTKVHVVAHCVGGLAVHMALVGGHVWSTHLASLSCTNSSMFFKLNALATFKMWLPLVPLSMAILGKDKILALLETSKISFRHQLLKCIACFIPRQSTTRVPMAAFSHLRKICNSGFIVNSHGKNSYLIHPERMAVSTLYISGGRSLLVTPETSFLANNYMKLHQPSLRHERIVVEGFGHSDLWIGEESYKKVFPPILCHIRLAEQGGNPVISSGKICSGEALAWEDDPYSGYGGFGSWFSPSIITFLLLLWLVILISVFI
ncbi:hypothetical protein Patl1_32632 [Pistacia atlantica]|uniref:Uncharacterized protein n=1 Tax=Pistacia atlantica TaxID=434234 RepID=A0ACC1AMM8_9ROSI|nr:hypothetical protein Patl1_32632 [Pistacia atlantica]